MKRIFFQLLLTSVMITAGVFMKTQMHWNIWISLIPAYAMLFLYSMGRNVLFTFITGGLIGFSFFINIWVYWPWAFVPVWMWVAISIVAFTKMKEHNTKVSKYEKDMIDKTAGMTFTQRIKMQMELDGIRKHWVKMKKENDDSHLKKV